MKDMTQLYPEGQSYGYESLGRFCEPDDVDDYGMALEDEAKSLGLTVEQYENFPYQFPAGTCFRYEAKIDRCTIESTLEDERHLTEMIKSRNEIDSTASIFVKIPSASEWTELDEDTWLNKTYKTF